MRRPAARSVLALAEVVAFAGAAPLLIFATPSSVAALVALPVFWLARLIVCGAMVRRTAADWPLAGLLLMLVVSLYPSVDLTLSRPKLFGLILGSYLFALLVAYARGRAWSAALVGALVLGGVGVALAGLVGTNWSLTKLPPLGPVYARLPQLVEAVPTSFGTMAGGLHPNEVGGALALLAPVALGLALFATRWWVSLVTGLAAAVMVGVLVLTGSRSGLLGLLAGALVLGTLRWRRLVFALPVFAAGAVAVPWLIGFERLTGVLLTVDLSTTSVTEGRLLIWARAVAMLHEAPFTGIGLNTFPVVAGVLYPFYDLGPGAHVPHAHNLLLQVALDLGLLGLASFVGLLAVVAVSLGRAWRHASGWERGLVAGLGAGLLAHLVFGLTDAVTLGAKPGIFLWAVLGGAVALGCTASPGVEQTRVNASLVAAGALRWLQWALFTLACGLGAIITVAGIRTFP